MTMGQYWFGKTKASDLPKTPIQQVATEFYLMEFSTD